MNKVITKNGPCITYVCLNGSPHVSRLKNVSESLPFSNSISTAKNLRVERILFRMKYAGRRRQEWITAYFQEQ